MKKLANLFVFTGVETNDAYRLLGIVKGSIRILAWLSLLLGLIFFIIILIFGGGPDSPRIVSILALLLGLIYFIVLYVISSCIEIIVAIEDNTRKTVLLLGGRENK